MDIDTDVEQPLALSLSRFLASPSALLRLHSSSLLLQLDPSPLLPWVSSMLPCLTSSLPSSLSTSLATLASLTHKFPSLTRTVLGSVLSVSRQSDDMILLSRSVSLVASNKGEDQLGL